MIFGKGRELGGFRVNFKGSFDLVVLDIGS